MKEEIKALNDDHKWDLVTKKEGMKIIPNKWVFKVKGNDDGSLTIYKARLVAKGFKKHKAHIMTKVLAWLQRWGQLEPW